jgi:primosomal protein N' (replication factor Y)
MNKLCIARVVVPLPMDNFFDYRIPDKLMNSVKVGMRVWVSFNRKILTGYVVKLCAKSRISRLNPIIGTLDNVPLLCDNGLKLAQSIKNYYVCSLGEAIDTMLPNVLKHAKKIKLEPEKRYSKINASPESKTTFIQNLREELTLSYFKEEVSKRSQEGKRVILALPDKRMIKPVCDEIRKDTNLRVGIWHSKLSANNMLNLWQELCLDHIDVVIGTRSCVLAPLQNLSLIIIKDENNYAHKEDQVPYYHAVKIAQMRAEIENCDVFLSSQVPSANTFLSLSEGKIGHKTIAGSSPLPKIQVNRYNFKDKIDLMLEKEIESALESKQKILVLLNRKGFATSIYCQSCKETLKCERCSSNLRFAYAQKILICPSCNFQTEAKDICPKCNSAYVKFSGLGIEKLESNLQRLFPQAKIVKIDEIEKQEDIWIEHDIIITTSKILNFDDINADLTIIWDFDSLLNTGDFHSGEQAFYLLSGLLIKTKGKMIICTSLSQDFYFFNSLRNIDYAKFYNEELRSRNQLKLPPYYHIGLVSVRSFKKEKTQLASVRILSYFNKQARKDTEVFQLDISRRTKIRGKYYSYIFVKSKSPIVLNKVIKKAIGKFRSDSVIITANIDPV